MPHVIVKMIEGRSEEQKQAFGGALGRELERVRRRRLLPGIGEQILISTEGRRQPVVDDQRLIVRFAEKVEARIGNADG